MVICGDKPACLDINLILEITNRLDWLRQEVRHGYHRLIYLSRQAKRLSDELDEMYYRELACNNPLTPFIKGDDDDGGMNVEAKEKLNVLSQKGRESK